jgi:transcriptional regulator with PAS, ATPase and Fis domain
MSPHTLTMTMHSREGRQWVEVPDVRVKVTTARGGLEATLQMHPLTIGTDPGCDVVVNDAKVSRRHCELSLVPEGVRLRDLNSKNGTLVHSVRVESVLLPPQTVVQLGDSSLSWSQGSEAVQVELSHTSRFGEAIGQSLTMRALFQKLERAARSDMPVLLLGESGTGKDVLAQAIHSHSERRDGPFVVCDCTSLTETLAESTLFGHVKGAFTGASDNREGLFQMANGGTLFFDELGELPASLQPKLLRALETKKVRAVGSNQETPADVRVVCATHRDIHAQMAAGTFRKDLYFRLAVVEAQVPSLRERRDDVPLLVEALLKKEQPPRSLKDLPPRTLNLLAAYDWPGNVRELKNIIARLIVFPDTRPEQLLPAAAAKEPTHWQEARADAIAAFESRFLEKALARAQGNVTAAAKTMGVSRQLIYQLLTRYGLKADDER